MLAIHAHINVYQGMTEGLTAQIRAFYRVGGDIVIAFQETDITQVLPVLYFAQDGRVSWSY